MEHRLSVSTVVAILKRYGLKQAESVLVVGDRFSFDAIMFSKDPQPLVVLEHKERPDAKSLRDFARKLETLVWTLYTHNKRHSVTAILLLGSDECGREARELVKRLSGTCRLFILTTDMPKEDVESELLSAGTSLFAGTEYKEEESVELIEQLAALKTDAERPQVAELARLAEECTSTQDLHKRLRAEFRNRIREVEDALAKPDN